MKSDTPNAGRGFRSGTKSPIRGGRAGKAATGTNSQVRNYPTTQSGPGILKPGKPAFPQYGRGRTQSARSKG